MTKWIKAALAGFSFLVLVTPAFADASVAPVCKVESLAAAKADAASKADQGINFIELSQELRLNLIANKGLPPHAQDGQFQAFFMDGKDHSVAMIFIFKDGCLVDSLGPAPEPIILKDMMPKGNDA